MFMVPVPVVLPGPRVMKLVAIQPLSPFSPMDMGRPEAKQQILHRANQDENHFGIDAWKASCKQVLASVEQVFSKF